MTAAIWEDRLRIILFMTLMLIYLEFSDLLPRAAPMELYGLVATVSFFATIFLMYVTVVAFLEWDGGKSISTLGLKTDSKTINQLLIGGLLGTAGAIVVILFALVFGGQLRPPSEITGDLITNEIIITSLVAFVEELTYRGYLLTRMERIWGRNHAILGSSLIFSLLHFGWWTPLGVIPLHLVILFTLNIFLGGVVLSFSYYVSGRRLWVPLGFHFMWNILAYVIFPVYPRDSVFLPEIFQIEWGVTTVVGFLFALSLVYVVVPLVASRSEKRKRERIK
ncbi:MAG: CPBP family intramembrane metalloprotease [Candidatus Thorarchaeota archaeon]|nr:CPBP family intramembrane metalloprotease [Candidatus Thorarchaeota archaeon]